MSNTSPCLKKKAPTKTQPCKVKLCWQKLPSALPVENSLQSSQPAPKTPSGTKPAVPETTNKVISLHWHSLPLCQKCKEDELPHKLLATFAPPEVTSSLFIFSFRTLGKVYQSGLLCQKSVHLGPGAVTSACREEKRFQCFLVLFSPLRCFQRLERRAELKSRLNLLLLKVKVDGNDQFSPPPPPTQRPRWLGSLITEMRAGQDPSSPLSALSPGKGRPVSCGLSHWVWLNFITCFRKRVPQISSGSSLHRGKLG